VIRRLPGGFELDDDRARVDVAAVHRYLSEDSYWAAGRSFEQMEMLLRDAARVIGLYDGEGRQVGFARVVSDGARIAYLADVYVLPEAQGSGLGTELVREAVENGPHANLRWMLHTRDAHGLYARFGFGPPGDRLMERPPSKAPPASKAPARTDVVVEPMRPEDWPRVREIYAEGIATGDATFDDEPPEWDAWDRGHLAEARSVARVDGEVIGFVALLPTSARPVYRGVVWEEVYVAASARGRGVGNALLEAAIEASERAGIWTLQAGIFPENAPSLALHRRHGFRVVGVQERLGRHHGRWRDVLLLERRRRGDPV
jgi:phosphinothricin acetyltransferase